MQKSKRKNVAMFTASAVKATSIVDSLTLVYYIISLVRKNNLITIQF